jgi:hypothetical protein
MDASLLCKLSHYPLFCCYHLFPNIEVYFLVIYLRNSDTTYSAICYGLRLDCPDENTPTWNSFSYQYIGIILMVFMGWTFFLPKLGKILDLTSKGIYSIILNSVFLIYLGVSSWVSGKTEFTL